MISSNSELRNPNNGDESQPYFDDFESACSTPYVSAPSSPGRGGSISSSAVPGGFFYSAPASPIHFAFSQNSFMNSVGSSKDDSSVPMGFEFEFSARFGSNGPVQTGSMSSADELFLNGKIRPTMLRPHHPLAPLADLETDDDEDGDGGRGRDPAAAKSVRRRTRSMSPMRSSAGWIDRKGGRERNDTIKEESNDDDEDEEEDGEAGVKLTANASTSSSSASSSRSSSAGRNSKRWLFLKEFLRSKSEGSSNSKHFWSNISLAAAAAAGREKEKEKKAPAKAGRAKPANGVVEKKKNGGKKKTYELHYTANRAQAEEMRKKTYLPYRQGLLGCLGFSSKGYGAVNGLARALNPVSSR